MTKKITHAKVFCCLLLAVLTTRSFSQNISQEASLKAKIAKNIARTGITPSYLADAHIASSYKESKTGIEHIYLQQAYQGIDVYNQIISLAFKDDKLLYASGKFINEIEKKAGSATPSLSAQDAVLKAAAHLNLTALLKNIEAKTNSFAADKKVIFSPAGIAKRDIETKLYWTADSLGKLHLAWNVNIDVLNKPDWWNVRVDALSGGIVQKDNWTVYENEERNATAANKAGRQTPASSGAGNNQLMAPPSEVNSATYFVIPFPADNKNVRDFALVKNPWEAAGAGNKAATYGWQYDGAADYTITRGNNVYAYEDTAAKNIAGKSAVSITPLPDLQFIAKPDSSRQPYYSANQYAAITNLFYWNNLMHDVMYQYGFDETSGNFQADNMLRGGEGNDYVLAEAEDGSGVSNANFNTPVDGSSGRMQMYVWPSAPLFSINTPASIAGNYNSAESAFSVNNQLVKIGTVTDTVVFYNVNEKLGCVALPEDSTSVQGKIALLYRGGNCNFTVKVKNAQNAGAVGVIVVNNVSGNPFAMGGSDSTITIPAVMISSTDGTLFANVLLAGITETATMSPGIALDGDLDNGIICHEYGHGVSNRLTGGPANTSCLSNGEEGGEGWSDYQALMMTTNWATEALTDGANPRGIGTYAYGEGYTGNGVRRYPYSTDLTIDPLTYANMAGNTEVHAIGEIWCAAVWDMTWNIIQQEGIIEPDLYNAASTGGNTIALQLVLEGMKLQTCSPGFLDARDAILAADSILYGYKHKCAIWNAFARRGMGVSAIEGSPNSAADGTAAFDVPGGATLTRSTDPIITKGEFTETLTATCGCNVPAGKYNLTDTIPSGFAYVSSKGGSAKDSVVTFPLTFSSPLEVQTVSLTLSSQTTGCNIDTVIYDDRDAHTTGGFVSSTTLGDAKWDTTATKSYSPTHSWYAPDGDTVTQYILTSGNFTPTGLSLLSFWHYISTEYGFDGGLVELQINNGNWIDAAPYFTKNGYNAVIDATADNTHTIFPKTSAFSGTPFSTFSQTLVNLSSFNDSTVKVRFTIHSNQAVNADGWYIDDITVANGCGGFQKIGLYDTVGNRVDSFSIPVYAIPALLPVTLVNFTAAAQGNSALLTWKTASEINMKEFTAEVSKNGIFYASIGTVKAKGKSSNDYTLYDLNPYNGSNYYRIKMVNTDGSFTYSPVRAVLFTSKGLIVLKPNPATSSTTVYFDNNLKVSDITLTDMQGKVLRQIPATNITGSYTLHTSGLAAGTYLVKVTPVAGKPVTVKLVVNH